MPSKKFCRHPESLSLSLSFSTRRGWGDWCFVCSANCHNNLKRTTHPPFYLPFVFSFFFPFFSLSPQILFPCYLSWRIRKFEWPFNVTNTRVCSRENASCSRTKLHKSWITVCRFKSCFIFK